MFVIVTVASYRSGLSGDGWKSCVTRKRFSMFTTETADEPVVVKLSSAMLLVGPPSVALADPFTKSLLASATPHPSSQAARRSERRSRFRDELGGRGSPHRGPAAEPVPSATPRYPSGSTARSTDPLLMHAAGKHA